MKIIPNLNTNDITIIYVETNTSGKTYIDIIYKKIKTDVILKFDTTGKFEYILNNFSELDEEETELIHKMAPYIWIKYINKNTFLS